VYPRGGLFQYLMSMSGMVAGPRESSIEFRVRYAETDQMGVVYHANYLVWCEMGRTDLIRQLGTSYAELERGGVALAVIDASVRYHAAARYDNLIRVRTVITEVRSRTVSFDYRIEDALTGERLASASTTLASLNGEGKLVALPDEIRKVMEDATT
jgi:acyl-CoA thioester hydrolase